MDAGHHPRDIDTMAWRDVVTFLHVYNGRAEAMNGQGGGG